MCLNSNILSSSAEPLAAFPLKILRLSVFCFHRGATFSAAQMTCLPSERYEGEHPVDVFVCVPLDVGFSFICFRRVHDIATHAVLVLGLTSLAHVVHLMHWPTFTCSIQRSQCLSQPCSLQPSVYQLVLRSCQGGLRWCLRWVKVFLSLPHRRCILLARDCTVWWQWCQHDPSCLVSHWSGRSCIRAEADLTLSRL